MDIIGITASAVLADTGGGGGGGYVGPLDIAGGAVVAVGNRAMSAELRGSPLYTIRRDNDDATQSFSSDATTGAAPSSDIETFIDVATGYITTLVNAGTGGNFTQGTEAQVPWIPNTFGDIPGLVVDTSGRAMFGELNTLAPTLTFIGALKFTAAGDPNIITTEPDPMIGGSVPFKFSTDWNATGDLYCALRDADGGNQTVWVTPGMVSDGNHIFEVVVEADGNVIILVDGVDMGAELDTGSPRTISTVSARFDFPDSEAADNGAGEGLVYFSTLSAPDRLALRQNMAGYYGITLP